MTPVYFTICARNYLAYALTLRASLLAAEPGARFFIFLSDAPIDGPPPCGDIVDASALALPNPDDMAFRYDVMEYATAVKPFCFGYLFDRVGADAAIYLDPDILVLRPLEPVIEALRAGAAAALTPHILGPMDDGRMPGEREILSSGSFNLGFAAFANAPEARAFLGWWGGKLATTCFADPAAGLFVDQKWADFAPSFIGALAILRDPGLNVAYWNLARRPLARDGAGWTAGGAPLCFFHFSGVAPGDAAVFSKHQNRFSPADLGEARSLLDGYLASLALHDHARWRAVPYAHDRYIDGALIPREARRLYARGVIAKPPGREGLFAPDHAALNAASAEADQDAAAPITVFMHEVWRSRPDLQALFPLGAAAGRAGFHRWFILNAAREHRAGEMHIAAARAGGAGPGKAELRARMALRRFAPGLKKFLRG